MPGPIKTASLCAPIPSSVLAASAAMLPSGFSGSSITRDSGTANATSRATLLPVAIVSLPAPARKAAQPARITAPGISREPPMTSTRPRSSLSPSSDGCGRGQRRSTSSVSLIVDAGGAVPAAAVMAAGGSSSCMAMSGWWLAKHHRSGGSAATFAQDLGARCASCSAVTRAPASRNGATKLIRRGTSFPFLPRVASNS